MIAAGRQRILELEGEAGLESSVEAAASNQSEVTQLGESQARAARRVLQHLKLDATVHLDVLVDEIDDMSPSEIIASLFELEILGLVRQQPGRNFAKVW